MTPKKVLEGRPLKPSGTTKIDYTLEQFIAEQKNRKNVIEVLGKIANTMEKLVNNQALIMHRLEKLEKRK